MANSLAQSFQKLWVPADRVLRAVELTLALVAGVILLGVMMLVVVDSVMRYAFNAPLVFQYTLTEDYLLVALLLLAMPWGFRTGGYIRITALVAALPSVLGSTVARAGILVCAGYAGVLAWTSGVQFLKVFASGEMRIGVMELPVYLSWICVPVGCGVMALRLVLLTLAPGAELDREHEHAEDLAV
ncbi:TRAP transporter small permease [Afifella sp. IM 167]|uniref:TRAP transporter small permease n=1 Tax=Afifella sp. IM 167 TaxID=2033586 RepID=UPI001CD04093|nr:TRAP transporter small permease [Afifella sp. IM 167]